MNKDTVGIVCSFLPIVDVIRCRQAGLKNINVVALFRSRYIAHLMKVCYCSREHAIELINKVACEGGLFSGSSVLQVLLGEKYHGSDIDIYFPQKSPHHMTVLLSNIFDTKMRYAPAGDDYFEREIAQPVHSNGLNFVMCYDYRMTPLPLDRQRYKYIQIITYDKQMNRPIHLLVTENFHLSITMNSFTGTAVETYNFNMLTTKQCILFRARAHRKDHYKKYVARGFTMHDMVASTYTPKGYQKIEVLEHIRRFDRSILRRVA
jgi:hypothetical protein